MVRCSGTADVSAALRICHRHSIPVVPIAADTGLEGGANGSAGTVCLDLSGMDRILRIGAKDCDATVQCGAMKSALNAELTAHALAFPVGSGVDAGVGGMASTGPMSARRCATAP